MVSGLVVNEGTQTAIAVDTVGTLEYGVVKIDMGTAGASNPFSGTLPELTNLVGGTISSLANLAKGTVTRLELGTVTGEIAAGTTDSGNPVKVGGVNRTTLPTLTDGQRGDLQLSTRGAVYTVLKVENSTTAMANRADNADAVGTSTTSNNLGVSSRNTVFNGTSWDRMSGDTTGINVKSVLGGTITVWNGTTNVLFVADNATAVAPTSTVDKLAVVNRNYVMFNSNGSWERQRQIENATNSTGVGISAAGILAQFDDSSPTSITENQFGNLRISANRNLYNTIRDAAGNERGANVTAANELLVAANTGTVQLNPKPSRSIITYGTTIGGGAAAGVTLVGAAGSGTAIFLNEISVTNQGTGNLTYYVGYGTASTLGTSNVLSGILAGNGGIQKSYPKAVGGHITNLALLGSIAAAGTVSVNLSYWVE